MTTQTNTTISTEAQDMQKSGALLLLFVGVFFLAIFAWFLSGAFVEDPVVTEASHTVRTFRFYLPLLLGLLSILLSTLAISGKLRLGSRERSETSQSPSA